MLILLVRRFHSDRNFCRELVTQSESTRFHDKFHRSPSTWGPGCAGHTGFGGLQKLILLQVTTIFSGVLPFGAATVELHYVMSSLFASKAYYAFGFLALTAGVVALTTATITILFTYFILCAEEYRWHWRAFLAGGGSAIWVFGYGIVYWLTQISTSSGSSFVLYVGYLVLMSVLVFLMTGE